MAWAGGSIAYVPFLTVLLPSRVADLAGGSAVDWLAYIAFVGAIAASFANIGFGWLSDIARNRRGFVAAGLVLSCTMLVFSGSVEKLSSFFVFVAVWQLSLNMMLGPLAAWAGDCVPDNQKGLFGGLLSVAPAIGAIVGMFVTIPGLAGDQQRLNLVAVIVALCVLPVLLFSKPRHFPELLRTSGNAEDRQKKDRSKSNAVLRMWVARLLVQIAEAALFANMLLWFRTLSAGIKDNDIAIVYGIVLITGIPLAMLAGRWADQRNKPIVPLVLCVVIVVAGLLTMAIARDLSVALAGYVLFGIAGTVFLSLHSAQTLRVLPRPETRGRDLGIFNLTNTVPSLVMPWLTLALVPVFGFSGLFALLAMLAATAFVILLTISR